ncbi:DUF3071 domain-containing protein [Nocardioides sp. W3-2-3]|nr:DUF3071 domain-containing protein [Nocardioides convexus]
MSTDHPHAARPTGSGAPAGVGSADRSRHDTTEDDTVTEQDDAGTAPDAVTALSLAGTSPDRRRLLLVDDQGSEFTLDITPDLRTAVRGETTRLGQLETKMSSSIRPREIQTRIRAGESAEAVATAAGTTVDAIMPYVAPVLAEREHVAARALKASLRRTPGEGSAAHTQSRVLGDAVAAHLRAQGADPAEVTWDAYRRETGRWVLTGAYTAAGRTGTARFTYDAPGNYALSDNDDARWLVGEALPEPAAPARDDLQQVRERRLAAVPADESAARWRRARGASRSATPSTRRSASSPARPPRPWSTSRSLAPPASARSSRPWTSRSAPPPRRRPPRTPPPRPSGPSTAGRCRRSVAAPRSRAWDEIMFGGSDQA